MATQRKFARPVLGDIVEIPLTRGFAYGQYVYNYTKPPRWGALVRVFPDTFDKRPGDFSDLVNGNERFVVFMPLAAAVNQEMVKLVDRAAVPARFSKLPVFKAAGFLNKAGIVKDWWLWDGEREWRSPGLSADEARYPLREIPSIPVLIDRIESGWKPEDEVGSVD